jgi:hypothetical protein
VRASMAFAVSIRAIGASTLDTLRGGKSGQTNRPAW